MLQLTATDAMYVEREAPGPPQHLSPVLVYGPSSTPVGHIHYREVLETFRRNLHKCAIFRRCLLRAPLNLDRPYWIEDQDFDLDYHVRHIALPKPGNWRQARQLLARLHAVPLDMSRPLWEAYVIEGLHELPGQIQGSFAVLLKIHRSAASNQGIAQLIDALHQTNPSALAPQPGRQWRSTPEPSTLHMLLRAYFNGFQRPSSLLRSASALQPGLSERLAHWTGNAEAIALEKPLTRFIGPVSQERVTDLLTIHASTVTEVTQRIPGPSAYAVLVSIIGGALRLYLEEKNELPVASLTATLPVTERATQRDQQGHGYATQPRLTLGTHIEDPVERLLLIHESFSAPAPGTTRRADPAAAHRATVTTSLWPSPWPNDHAPAQQMISSLAPTAPAYLASARLSTLMVMPALVDNMGLHHSLLRHDDHFALMFVACRAMLPDAEFYTACLAQSLRRMETAARHHSL